LEPDAPVDVLTGGGGGGGAGVECVGVGVVCVVCVVDEPPVDFFVVEPDFFVVEPDDLVVVCDEPTDLEVVPGVALAAAPALAGATPEMEVAWAARLATVLRSALTWAVLAAMAFCSATTCGSSDAAGAAGVVELPVVEVTGW
jgi:hypothetical protein